MHKRSPAPLFALVGVRESCTRAVPGIVRRLEFQTEILQYHLVPNLVPNRTNPANERGLSDMVRGLMA